MEVVEMGMAICLERLELLERALDTVPCAGEVAYSVPDDRVQEAAAPLRAVEHLVLAVGLQERHPAEEAPMHRAVQAPHDALRAHPAQRALPVGGDVLVLLNEVVELKGVLGHHPCEVLDSDAALPEKRGLLAEGLLLVSSAPAGALPPAPPLLPLFLPPAP